MTLLCHAPEPPAAAAPPRQDADPLIATRQHIQLIQNRRARLAEALIDAELQYLTDVRREWEAGNLTWTELHDAYELLREGAVDGYTTRWINEIGIHRAKIRAHMERQPNGADGSWHGVWPLPQGDAYPLRGQSVVYVLFDASNRPIYVGSSHNWRSRMDQHRRAGKVWTSWLAHPCSSRQEAYAVENRFLAQYMPDLNVAGPREMGADA